MFSLTIPCFQDLSSLFNFLFQISFFFAASHFQDLFFSRYFLLPRFLFSSEFLNFKTSPLSAFFLQDLFSPHNSPFSRFLISNISSFAIISDFHAFLLSSQSLFFKIFLRTISPYKDFGQFKISLLLDFFSLHHVFLIFTIFSLFTTSYFLESIIITIISSFLFLSLFLFFSFFSTYHL